MKRTLPAIALLIGAFTACAQGMQAQLETTFHSMATTTNPRFDAEGRPVASLGAVSFRTPVTRPQLLSLDPPRFSGGCGGIDLYGGSFSFISREELQGLMRQIAANAKSYAFNLALGAVCNKCLQEMQALQDKVQRINQMMKSSCDVAQAIVNTAADPAVAQMQGRFQEGALAARQGGTVSDLFASMNQGWGKPAPESALATEAPDDFARIEPGNIVWRLLKEHRVGQWFSDADEALLVDLQSFIGTVIICAPHDGSTCGADAPPPEDRPGTVQVRVVPAVLGVNELVHGERTGGLPLVRITCPEASHCLDARISAETSAREGLEDRVRQYLVGDPTTGANGYIARQRSPEAQVTAQDRALRSNAPSQFGLLDAAIDSGEAPAQAVADVLAEAIALELVDAFLGQVLVTLRQGAAQLGPAESQKLLELVDAAADRTRQQHRVMVARQAHRVRLLEGLGLTLDLATTPDLRSGPIAPPGQ